MARYQCHDCRVVGIFTYKGEHDCPFCTSDNVQIALSVEEMDDGYPLFVALNDPANGEEAGD
jgi:hypothetical protein